MSKDIDYALVEGIRPPLYTCMKYWGKKPHNIWNAYISNYTNKNGIYFDPFTGSAMSAFESIKAKRRAIAFDINPLSSFVIEVVCSNFSEKKFKDEVSKIISFISNDKGYRALYCYRGDNIIHNVKWENDVIYEVCTENSKTGDRKALKPTKDDIDALKIMTQIDIVGLYPNKSFRKSNSYTDGFLKSIGNTYDCLYTKRNLYVLSLIFNKILENEDIVLKKQLLFAFIQTVHLSTRMCVPRSKKTNRDYSTSWGRSAFLYSKKQMEMNPLLLFENNCIGKQSVCKCLNFAKTYFKRKPIIRNINEEKYNPKLKTDLWYGIYDIKKISNVIQKNTVDFILTDPPYGGLIQYLDLSTVWLSWLELFDIKYSPSFEEEITVNNDNTINDFENDFTFALKQLHLVLKDEGKLILTFNNKDIKIWGAFLNSIADSGFRIEKVIHQHNKRSGESNVSDPNGTSASDYYIRCIKSSRLPLVKITKTELEKIMLEKTRELIMERNEPTPYDILFNGLLVKVSQAGFDLREFDSDLEKFFNRHEGKELIKMKNTVNRAGDYWWVTDIKFKNNSKTLSNRVRKTLMMIFEKNTEIKDDILFEIIFKKYPNGQTPDVDTLNDLIKEYAIKKGDTFFRRK